MGNADRVVVTGLGVVAPNGVGVAPFWASLLEARSAIGPITLFDASGFPSRIAGEVRDFRPDYFLDPSLKARRMNRFTQFTLVAARMALAQANLSLGSAAEPIPLWLGVSLGGIDRLEGQMKAVHVRGARKVAPSAVEPCMHASGLSALAAMLGGPVRLVTLSNTCVGGMDAIGMAAEQIRRGEADVALAGGADGAITETVLAGLCGAGMVSQRNEDPSGASRPFDRLRDGGVLAEGGAVVVVESLGRARARGARPRLELLARGGVADLAGGESGAGLEPSMAEALDEAGLDPDAIDGVFAHAPSDPVIDRVESAAIRSVLGPRALHIPVTSIKGVTGNPLAAGGAFQVVAAAQALAEDRLPPVANYQHPDPDCTLDIVAGRPRLARIRTLLLNAHGSSRTNAALVVRAPPPTP